jgi:hypothetical protein
VTAEIACPDCGETEALQGEAFGDLIRIECRTCGRLWDRDPAPRCPTCGGGDLEPVPAAIVEKGRGTQLSVVGIRTVHLCSICDADTIARYHRNRPNPLMPDELPNTETDGDH